MAPQAWAAGYLHEGYIPPFATHSIKALSSVQLDADRKHWEISRRSATLGSLLRS